MTNPIEDDMDRKAKQLYRSIDSLVLEHGTKQMEIWHDILDRSTLWHDTFKSLAIKAGDEIATGYDQAFAWHTFVNFIVHKGPSALALAIKEHEQVIEDAFRDLQKGIDKAQVHADQLRVLDLVLDWNQRRKAKEIPTSNKRFAQ